MADTVAAASQTPTHAAADVPLSGLASIGRHALLYAVGTILGKAVAFLMLPIYTRYLSPADYGIAALIEMTLDVIGIVAGAQIAQGVFRFYHKADADADRRAVVSTALSALMLSYGVLAAAIFVAATPLSRLVFQSPAHAGLIRLAAGSFALQGIVLVTMAYGRVQERSGLVVGASLVRLLIAVALNLVFVVAMRRGVEGVFLSTLGSNLVIAVWLGAWTIRRVGVGVRGDVLRSLVRYGAPLIGVQAATFTLTFADRYFLKAAADTATVGLYNLAYQFGFLLLMLGFVPIEMIWGPRRFQVARGPNPGPTLAKAFRLINVSVMTIGVGIALFVGDLLRVMATPPFHPAANVVPIILIAYVFHGWAMLHDIGVLVKEKTEYLTIANWVAALVALAAFAILIPQYHAHGAAAAAVLAFSVRWALTYRFSQRLWHVDYDWAPVLRLIAAALTVAGASLVLPDMNLVASIGVHVLLFVLYLLIVWSLPILTPGEKATGVDYARRFAGLVAGRLGRNAASPRPAP